MTDGCVYISGRTAEALTALDIFGEYDNCESWERMAGLLYILKELPDSNALFPRGKWATIQEIEQQVVGNARAVASRIRN